MLVTRIFSKCFPPFPKQISSFELNSICSLQMLSIWTSLKFRRLVKSQLFTKLQNFKTLTKLKAFADNKFTVAKIMISVFDRMENSWQRRKCCLPAFSSFPTMFSKALCSKVVKTHDCMVKS